MMVYYSQSVYQLIPDLCESDDQIEKNYCKHTASSWADSICVLEDFQEITLDSQ